MVKAIRIHQAGGPEKMRWEDVALGAPGPGQVLVRNTAIGLNFIDTYHRSGLYPMPLPFTLGMEGAGVVEAVGPKVKEFKAGDRVAYAARSAPMPRNASGPADRLVKIPAGIDDKLAAAIMLKGMTAQYLLPPHLQGEEGRHDPGARRGRRRRARSCRQWARHLGATVIGTVGNDDKVAIAKKAGCKHVIVTGARERRRSGSRRSPRARACRWSMTASARTRSWARSTAWRRSA